MRIQGSRWHSMGNGRARAEFTSASARGFQGGATQRPPAQPDAAGANWSAPRVAARTKGASDHPLLVARREDAFLSWLATDEGYRLIALR